MTRKARCVGVGSEGKVVKCGQGGLQGTASRRMGSPNLGLGYEWEGWDTSVERVAADNRSHMTHV